MAQIKVGDLVLVQGLMNQTHYNGRQGVVTKLISSYPENKCEATVFSQGPLEGKQLILKMRCVHLLREPQALGDRSPRTGIYMERQELCTRRQELCLRPHGDHLFQGPSIRPMVWGSPETRGAFEEDWKRSCQANDPWWFQYAARDIYLYLILKLAKFIRSKSSIGQAAWSFQPRRVGDLHYGCVWGHGGREQENELPSGSAADIMRAGSAWWPVIWVDVPGDKVPVHCPALAWQNARPWWAHRSRLREVETPGVIIEELEPEGEIPGVGDV